MTESELVRKILRLAWIAGGIALIGWIAARNLPPSGRLSVAVKPGEASPFVGILRPDDRVRLIPGDVPLYEITDDPVYFQLALPRFYHRVKVRIEYQDTDEPIIEAGPRTDLAEWQFDLEPLEARVLDDAGWSVRTDGEYRIYERHPTTRTAAQILEKADAAHTAVYHLPPLLAGSLPVINAATDLATSRLNTVVAIYTPPVVLPDGWRSASFAFDASAAAQAGGETQTVISVPGLHAGKGLVRVRSIAVEYGREPWSWTMLSSAFSRLFAKR